MPVSYPKYRRRRYRRRVKSTKPEKPLLMGVSKKDKVQDKQIRRLKKMLKPPEVKFTYSRVTATNAVVAGAIVAGAPMNALPEGTGEAQRIGHEVNDKRFILRCRASNALANSQQNFRLIVFKWHEENTPLVSDILAANGGTTDYLSTRNYEFRKESKILFDKTYMFGRENSAANPYLSSTTPKHIHVDVPVKGKQYYTGSLAATLISGAIWVLAIGSVGVEYEFTTEYHYTDD